MEKDPSVDSIMQIGLGFWASKTLLSAVELGLFTELGAGALDAETLRQRLDLHPRSAGDFFDALVAMKFLDRREGKYSNSVDADFFLDRNKPSYAGGLLEMANARLYGFWGSLTQGLHTGQLQNESKAGGEVFASLYSTPEKLESFLKGMTGLSLAAAKAIAEKFDWTNYRTFADIGCAQGGVPVVIARTHSHLRGIGYDLPEVRPIFERYVREHQMEERVRFQTGDFFNDALPSADVLIMGHILHDWDLDQKRILLRKAYQALPEGGSLIVFEAIIDDERRENAFGLLMSLNMLIETPGGFDYTGADCQSWMREVGFRETRVEHLIGP
ncbi:MAG TPA: methyltransferase, partial [Terrimicrobiaceae bacterium]